MKCPICGALVKFILADAGKIVHCLDEDINQVTDLYRCTNEHCELSTINFNPTARFDYGRRYYGADVLQFIAREVLDYDTNSTDLMKRLKKRAPKLEISEDTIRRISDDVILLKAFKIDQKTREKIQKQGKIILAFDGQDPDGNAPGIWCFLDLISGRVLATVKFESLDYKLLHETIKAILKQFSVKVLGWVTDKQNVITACHDAFYTDIPHQYCQFHFLKHLWDHLECLDSVVYLALKKAISGLYIHKANANVLVEFEGKGKLSVRSVFKEIDNDLQTMARARNKTFKDLRGQLLYRTLQKYLDEGRSTVSTMNHEYRLTINMQRTIDALQTAMDGIVNVYEDVKLMQPWFQQIRERLADLKTPWQEKQRQIDEIFQQIVNNLKDRCPQMKLDNCKSFLPKKGANSEKVMGEWCRLWNSYLPGLFQYEQFPGTYRTNNYLDNIFSVEKQELISRVGKGNVSHILTTRGEAYLRLKCCDPGELDTDIISEFNEEVVRALRDDLRNAIKAQTETWRTMSREYRGFNGVRCDYYPVLSESALETTKIGMR
jgi:hypothetical protein